MKILTTVYVTGVVARPKEIIKIPVNIRGAGVHFAFDDNWAGLTKNVVFRSAKTVAVADAPDIVEIPEEVVGVVGTDVSVGICGLSADGKEIIPTLWADLGTVLPSAAGDFPPPEEQGLPVWAQIQRDLINLTGVVDSLDRRISDPGFAPRSDLSQNDPLKNDYILNRTHWLEPVETAVSWDGDTRGRRTYTDQQGTVYYKIADKCPEEEYVMGSTVELSNGNTLTVSKKMFYGFSNGAAKVGSFLYLRRNAIVSAGNVIDTDSVGIYATAGTVYPAVYRYNEIVVHPLDERFIPESIARKSELGSSGSGGGLSIRDDDNGNVTIVSTGSVSITDDGAGNVTIA